MPALRHVPRILIGLVWLINGLWCKVLGQVPRHERIVADILGETHAPALTVAIGIGEVALAFWIWADRRRKPTAGLQIALVTTMNALEFFLAPDQLLWGRWNALFAAGFVAVVAWHGFAPEKTQASS